MRWKSATWVPSGQIGVCRKPHPCQDAVRPPCRPSCLPGRLSIRRPLSALAKKKKPAAIVLAHPVPSRAGLRRQAVHRNCSRGACLVHQDGNDGQTLPCSDDDKLGPVAVTSPRSLTIKGHDAPLHQPLPETTLEASLDWPSFLSFPVGPLVLVQAVRSLVTG